MIAVVIKSEEEFPDYLYLAPDVAVDEIINTNDIDQYVWDNSPTWELVWVWQNHSQDDQIQEHWDGIIKEYSYVFVLPVTEEWEETGEYPMFRDIFYYHDGKRHVA